MGMDLNKEPGRRDKTKHVSSNNAKSKSKSQMANAAGALVRGPGPTTHWDLGCAAQQTAVRSLIGNRQ
jgi:hypothetical protein